MLEDVNEHAQIIADHVFHSFPYGELKPNFKGPHAEDCEGCIIEGEVEKLVSKLNALSPVEEIVAELNEEKERRRTLGVDRHRAFDRAGVPEEGTVADLVANLVDERDQLISLIEEIGNQLTHLIKATDSNLQTIRNRIKENK